MDPSTYVVLKPVPRLPNDVAQLLAEDGWTAVKENAVYALPRVEAAGGGGRPLTELVNRVRFVLERARLKHAICTLERG